MNQNIKMISPAKATAPLDTAKWILVALLLIGGIVANTYFNQVNWAIRTAIGLLDVVAIAFIIFQTASGRVFWRFVQAARVELRKVVWPTRQETMQTTLMVVAMVVVTALVLWGLDTLFFWLVGLLTGQRG